MIIDLPGTTTSAIAKQLVAMREEGGAVALGRVLTLLIVTGEDTDEIAIRAANEASGEHPMRVIVVETAAAGAPDGLDAQIRVGGDAGASEVIRLRAGGRAADDPETLVQGLLLPDAPVVTWWANRAPKRPSGEPLGRIAQLRITDSTAADGTEAMRALAEGFAPGDSDLAWTRLTAWRAQLAAVLDQPPFEPIRSARVVGRRDAATSTLMAGWLALALRVPVTLDADDDEGTRLGGLHAVELIRDAGNVSLRRISDATIELRQDGQPVQHIAVSLSDLTRVLAEELRSLAPDVFLGRVLREGVPLIRRSRGEVPAERAASLDELGLGGGEGGAR